jgi:tRNA (Thr-GGU) A37 N-methylase
VFLPLLSLGLETYSHMFIQFIFNENTNIVKTLLTAGSNQDDESTLSSRASASKSSTFSQKVHSFASRVLPPLLGHPLGLFATRSPHRPNALGLSLCRIEKVDIENRSVEISGADLVDGSLVVGKLLTKYESLIFEW